MAKVLFLEDERILVEDLPVLLKEEGIEMKSTTSINQALEWFAEEEFDAVLLDIMMPLEKDMDAEQLDYGRETGVEVARRMKAIKPDVPIVALTVRRDPEIQAKMREAGVAMILNKPSELEQIATVLRQVCASILARD